MYLSGFAHAPYLMVKSESDLENIKPDFLENKYTVRLSGEYDEVFLNKFVQKFNNVKTANSLRIFIPNSAMRMIPARMLPLRRKTCVKFF